MGNSMVALIFGILQILTPFPAPQGSNGGQKGVKGSKISNWHTNTDQNLKIGTGKSFHTINPMVVVDFDEIYFFGLFGVRGSKWGQNGQKLAA